MGIKLLLIESQRNQYIQYSEIKVTMINGLTLQTWQEITLVLYKLQDNQRYCQKVYREITTSSSHVRNILKCMEKEDFIRRESKGRIKYIVMTEKGKEIAKNILKLKEDLYRDLSKFEKNEYKTNYETQI